MMASASNARFTLPLPSPLDLHRVDSAGIHIRSPAIRRDGLDCNLEGLVDKVSQASHSALNFVVAILQHHTPLLRENVQVRDVLELLIPKARLSSDTLEGGDRCHIDESFADVPGVDTRTCTFSATDVRDACAKANSREPKGPDPTMSAVVHPATSRPFGAVRPKLQYEFVHSATGEDEFGQSSSFEASMETLGGARYIHLASVDVHLKKANLHNPASFAGQIPHTPKIQAQNLTLRSG